MTLYFTSTVFQTDYDSIVTVSRSYISKRLMDIIVIRGSCKIRCTVQQMPSIYYMFIAGRKTERTEALLWLLVVTWQQGHTVLSNQLGRYYYFYKRLLRSSLFGRRDVSGTQEQFQRSSDSRAVNSVLECCCAQHLYSVTG